MLVSILGRIEFTVTFSASNNVHRRALCEALKTAARWVNVILKQKGKEVLCILEKFDLFLNSLNHGSIICNVSMVKLLLEFFSLEAQ